jgi:L,D-peptidoglycan transpeptidase YkuD (ErfK/YbiS/YcfS/YnhG family)
MRVFTASALGLFRFDGLEVRCALGRTGVVASKHKREGDGASPLGQWPIRSVLWRVDKLNMPATSLPLSPIKPADGWCDAPDDAHYNHPITHPYPASAEHLWRRDDLYDVIVILGYNDDPVVAGRGSAVFMHIATPDFRPTQGCIALALEDMLAFLAQAEIGDLVEIVT